MYCLYVLIAHPCYKRPRTEWYINHFSTKKEAEEKLVEIKKKYIADFEITNDGDLVSVDELNKMIRDGRLADYIYNEFYMDNEPFYSEIKEVIVKH